MGNKNKNFMIFCESCRHYCFKDNIHIDRRSLDKNPQVDFSGWVIFKNFEEEPEAKFQHAIVNKGIWLVSTIMAKVNFLKVGQIEVNT